jgi:hypothetical protein
MKPKIKTSRNKLIIELDGGLGNQLFLYSAGHYFGDLLNCEVVYDTFRLKKINHLHPGLNISQLGFPGNYAKSGVISRLRIRVLRSIWRRLSAQKNTEIGFQPYPSNLGLTNRVFGSFQSWRYFQHTFDKFRPKVRLPVLSEPTAWYSQLEKELKTIRPIVLHVRRSDYLKKENAFIGLLSQKYYAKAITELNSDKPIWVFSDDINLVKNEFQSLAPEIDRWIEPPAESDPYESMLLMGRGSALIIANSTFSLWAGMLAEDSTVVAPSKWFRYRTDPIDLLPASWKKSESEWMNDEG